MGKAAVQIINGASGVSAATAESLSLQLLGPDFQNRARNVKTPHTQLAQLHNQYAEALRSWAKWITLVKTIYTFTNTTLFPYETHTLHEA